MPLLPSDPSALPAATAAGAFGLHLSTLGTLLALQLLASALLLPLATGRPASRALGLALGAQALLAAAALPALLPAGLLSAATQRATAAMLAATALALAWEALQAWLGPRPGRLLVWTLLAVAATSAALAGPALPAGGQAGSVAGGLAGSWAGGPPGAAPIATAQGLLTPDALPAALPPRLATPALALPLAAQAGLLLLALAWPADRASRRWRGLAAATLAPLLLALPALAAWPGAPRATAAALLATQLAALGWLLAVLSAWRQEAAQALHALVRTDRHTGLLTRAAFEEAAATHLAQAGRHGDAAVLMLLTLHDRAALAARRAPPQPADALRLVATLMRQSARRADLVGHWDDETLAVLLARTDGDAASHFDRRLRSLLDERAPRLLGLRLATSAGMATWQPGDAALATLQARALLALQVAQGLEAGALVDGDGDSAATVLAALRQGAAAVAVGDEPGAASADGGPAAPPPAGPADPVDPADLDARTAQVLQRTRDARVLGVGG